MKSKETKEERWERHLKLAKKMHKILGHPGQRRLEKFVRDAGMNEADLSKAIKKVSEECKGCKRGGKPADRPKVALPLASEFNQVIAIDFMQIEKKQYLKVIDIGTRLMRNVLMQDRSANSVRLALQRNWFSIFGPPREAILGDRAREFMDETLVSMCNGYGVETRHSPSQAQFANGVVERHGHSIKETVKKMRHSKRSERTLGSPGAGGDDGTQYAGPGQWVLPLPGGICSEPQHPKYPER